MLKCQRNNKKENNPSVSITVTTKHLVSKEAVVLCQWEDCETENFGVKLTPQIDLHSTHTFTADVWASGIQQS